MDLSKNEWQEVPSQGGQEGEDPVEDQAKHWMRNVGKRGRLPKTLEGAIISVWPAVRTIAM